MSEPASGRHRGELFERRGYRPARRSNSYRIYPGALIPAELGELEYMYGDLFARKIEFTFDSDLLLNPETPVGIFWEELMTAGYPDPYKLRESLKIKDSDDELVRQLKRSLEAEVEWYAMSDNEDYRQKAPLVEPAKLVITREAFDKLKIEDAGRVRILEAVKKRAHSVKWSDNRLTPQQRSQPSVVEWYFDPQVYLEIITQYPWLLDKDLGCKSDDSGVYSFGVSYTGAKRWKP